jgi:hypothetical protein
VVVLAGKLTFHAALISHEKPFAPFELQEDATVPVLEMSARVKDPMSQKIQSHGVGGWCSERFNDVQGERWPSVRRFVEESNRRIEPDSMQASSASALSKV